MFYFIRVWLHFRYEVCDEVKKCGVRGRVPALYCEQSYGIGNGMGWVAFVQLKNDASDLHEVYDVDVSRLKYFRERKQNHQLWPLSLGGILYKLKWSCWDCANFCLIFHFIYLLERQLKPPEVVFQGCIQCISSLQSGFLSIRLTWSVAQTWTTQAKKYPEIWVLQNERCIECLLDVRSGS